MPMAQQLCCCLHRSPRRRLLAAAHNTRRRTAPQALHSLDVEGSPACMLAAHGLCERLLCSMFYAVLPGAVSSAVQQFVRQDTGACSQASALPPVSADEASSSAPCPSFSSQLGCKILQAARLRRAGRLWHGHLISTAPCGRTGAGRSRRKSQSSRASSP